MRVLVWVPQALFTIIFLWRKISFWFKANDVLESPPTRYKVGHHMF